MPMPAGTIAFTNGSTAVTGTDTTFTTDVTATDFIVVVAGGTSYMVGVTSVESDTGLTLVRNFDGPTTDGLTYRVVPVQTMQLITSQLSADTARAFRGFSLDKSNWQAVLSGTGDVTVTLPDGNTYTGPSWGNIITTLNGKAANGSNSDITSLSGLTTALSVAQGGTGATTASDARTALGVAYGTAAGTVAQGNESRLGTVDQKTGGTLTSALSVSGSITSSGEITSTSGTAFYASNNTIDGDGPNRVATGLEMQSSDASYHSFIQYYLVSGSYHCTRIVQNNAATFTARAGGACYATSFNPTSDGRLKLNKEVLTEALNKVETLTGYTFDLFGERRSGLIAQDIQTVLPEVVTETFTDYDIGDGTKITNALAVDYGAMTGLMVEAIKELSEKVRQIEAQLSGS